MEDILSFKDSPPILTLPTNYPFLNTTPFVGKDLEAPIFATFIKLEIPLYKRIVVSSLTFCICMIMIFTIVVCIYQPTLY